MLIYKKIIKGLFLSIILFSTSQASQYTYPVLFAPPQQVMQPQYCCCINQPPRSINIFLNINTNQHLVTIDEIRVGNNEVKNFTDPFICYFPAINNNKEMPTPTSLIKIKEENQPN